MWGLSSSEKEKEVQGRAEIKKKEKRSVSVSRNFSILASRPVSSRTKSKSFQVMVVNFIKLLQVLVSYSVSHCVNFVRL